MAEWRARRGDRRAPIPSSTAVAAMSMEAVKPLSDGLLLTVEEVAAILRLSRKAAYAMIERRQLPGVIRIGRRVRVCRAVLLDWLQQEGALSLETQR